VRETGGGSGEKLSYVFNSAPEGGLMGETTAQTWNRITWERSGLRRGFSPCYSNREKKKAVVGETGQNILTGRKKKNDKNKRKVPPEIGKKKTKTHDQGRIKSTGGGGNRKV